MTSSLVIPVLYPKRDLESNPQRDSSILENVGVKKEALRQILAENVARRMEESSDLDTQPKLAKKAGIGQSHVSRVLNGVQSIGLDVVAALSGAFHCQPWELLANDELTRRQAMERMLMGREHEEDHVLPMPPLPQKRIAFRRGRPPKRKG